MAEVTFRPVRQLSEYKGKGASASRETVQLHCPIFAQIMAGDGQSDSRILL